MQQKSQVSPLGSERARLATEAGRSGRGARVALLAALLALTTLAAACGSYLSVDEVRGTRPSGGEMPGVVINQLALYDAKLEMNCTFRNFADDGRCRTAHEAERDLSLPRLSGVDQTRRLSLNARRMMFASGTLKVEVNQNHLPKAVGVTGETGAARAATAADAVVKAEAERRQIEFDAKEAEKSAQAEGGELSRAGNA
jgi:hypothetical protein